MTELIKGKGVKHMFSASTIETIEDLFFCFNLDENLFGYFDTVEFDDSDIRYISIKDLCCKQLTDYKYSHYFEDIENIGIKVKDSRFLFFADRFLLNIYNLESMYIVHISLFDVEAPTKRLNFKILK